MIEIIDTIYKMLDNDIELQEIFLGGLPIYFMQRPNTRPPEKPKFPFVVLDLSTNHDSLVIQTMSLSIDIYDRDDSSECLIMAAERIKKIFERKRIIAPNDMVYGESTLFSEAFIEEEDRRIWHWSAEINIRGDKKKVIC